MGFGALNIERNEPVFHHEWEKRALGLSLCAACLGQWTIDESRHAYERISPRAYLRASYYEIWMRGLDTLLVENGLVAVGEIYGTEPRFFSEGDNALIVLRPSDVDEMLSSGPSERTCGRPPAFRVGDRVETKNLNPKGHTRLPGYARSKRGLIERVQGSYAFPDTNAHGLGANPQWVYTVVFSGREVWGEGADPTLTISIDAFESYLSRA
ncbi:nitrile hydratase [Phyllobacterium trifolii]|uniref:Nitrile hydratase subunit beta n=2 Tax=Phyllobacterium trifolii TaxID=300193 RepID=A0A839UEZ4_9HYPH|nr:nitrile hydratase [Phyllobacterium trifolii]